MRTIHKNHEPNSLTAHRKQPHADFDNYEDKDALRQLLVEEQHGLCCYCQSRIRPCRESMKIEHCQCQKRYPGLQLDYHNLLGACLGGHGQLKHEQHCDTHKGDEDLCFCLVDPAHPIEKHIKFLGNGEIQSDDERIDTAINQILNLNISKLVNNRKAVFDAFVNRLDRRELNSEHELQKWDGSQPGDLPEFAQVTVYLLKKKIRRAMQ